MKKLTLIKTLLIAAIMLIGGVSTYSLSANELTKEEDVTTLEAPVDPEDPNEGEGETGGNETEDPEEGNGEEEENQEGEENTSENETETPQEENNTADGTAVESKDDYYYEASYTSKPRLPETGEGTAVIIVSSIASVGLGLGILYLQFSKRKNTNILKG